MGRFLLYNFLKRANLVAGRPEPTSKLVRKTLSLAKQYMEQRASVGSLKDHALKIEEQSGKASQQGPGLYLAASAWRSSTYAASDNARLLVVQLKDVPTIDVRDATQMAELKRYDLDAEKLYLIKNLAEMLFLYSPREGNYARLTTNKGVTLTLDLKQVDTATLKEQAKKFGIEAKKRFKDQAKECGLDLTEWHFMS